MGSLVNLFTNLVQNLLCWIETGITDIINELVLALAALMSAMLSVLPAMPTLPLDSSGVIGDAFQWGSYFFPLSYLFELIGIVGVLWLTWLVIAIPLRWGKVTPGND